jgi:AraC-like DNA-binding protein
MRGEYCLNSDILREFLNYIDFLRELGYFVSLSGFSDRFEPYTSKLLNYEIHLHSVCLYLKQNQSTLGKCSLNKLKLNSAVISEPFYSCCYAGVEEYVIPVFYQDECVMRINVSGYRGKLEKSKKYAFRISKSCNKNFNRLYHELSVSVPTLEEIMRFISPLKYIAIELYKHCQTLRNDASEPSTTRQVYLKALHFINENYMQQISCDTLSSELSYSISYIQYVFKKEANTTIKAQIIKTRLSKAKHLLSHSQISITDIAFTCGFSDSNYFSTAFKNKYGISPKSYRLLSSK